MWNHLLAAVLLEQAGFHLKVSYEDTLNQYFLENPEDETLLELEFNSSNIAQSIRMLRAKYDRDQFAALICEELKELYENTALKEFVPCAYKLWQIMPFSVIPLSDLGYIKKSLTKKNMEQADAICREMFRYYADGLDRKPVAGESIGIQEYKSMKPGNVAPDFEGAERFLGFELHRSIRDFYSRVFAQKICGEVVIPDKGFTIPIGIKRFDTWFSFNKIKGRTEYRLLPCNRPEDSARFIRDQFYLWTGGNDFGERIMIGEFRTGIGDILILINNQTGAVEWVDCGYGYFDKYEKNPNGILAEDIEQFLQKL